MSFSMTLVISCQHVQVGRHFTKLWPLVHIQLCRRRGGACFFFFILWCNILVYIAFFLFFHPVMPWQASQRFCKIVRQWSIDSWNGRPKKFVSLKFCLLKFTQYTFKHALVLFVGLWFLILKCNFPVTSDRQAVLKKSAITCTLLVAKAS